MGKMSRIEKWFVNRWNRYLYHRLITGQLVPHLALPVDPSLLEIGCGTGHAAVLLNQTYRPRMFRVTDYDAAQLAKSHETFAATYGAAPSNVILETADALALRYEDRLFDAVFAFLVLHHLGKWWNLKSQVRAGLDEIHRVLNAGGNFVYLEIWHKGRIRAHLTKMGYVIVHRKSYVGIAELVIARKPS